MHNKVVYRIARGLRSAGAVVLRFNYRGVHLSEGEYAHGEGELEDARAALDYLRGRYPGLPFTLAGFSFGSRIVLRLGCERIWSAPGDRGRISHPYKDRSFLEGCTVPRVFVQSTHDQYGPVAELEPLVASLAEPEEAGPGGSRGPLLRRRARPVRARNRQNGVARARRCSISPLVL